MRYKLTIEYDGTQYAGWQKQHHAKTVQGEIETAIYNMTGERVDTIVAGRTDSGVHARGQVCHFDLQKEFKEFNLRLGINHHLVPNAIAILDVEKVDEEFNARFSAKFRYYKYYILNRPSPSPLNKLRAWFVFEQLDEEAMRVAAKHLEGEHNFHSFRSTECQANNPVRSIEYINIKREGDYLVFELKARSFLHNMVRNIVGTLKQVGTGHISADEIPAIIKAEDRSAAGLCAPAHALFFEKVEY
jgi:tRNA pseudouridine38-40 synthase